MVTACAAALGAACADEKSFALVSVVTTSGQITNVAQLWVDVDNGASSDFLLYPKTVAARPFLLENTNAVTFSIGFSGSRKGDVHVGVTAVDAAGRPLGYGATSGSIDVGHVGKLTVRVVPGDMRPQRDGGAGDGRGGDGDQGDDREAGAPDSISISADARSCMPTAPASCGGGQTCVVLCQADVGAGICTPGGSRQPGEMCQAHDDCTPGSQCFRFNCRDQGTQTQMCLRYCQGDGDCAGSGKCMTSAPVRCAGQPTPFRLCSRPCDPVKVTATGCPEGLACVLFPGEIPDCTCRDAHKRGEGERCQNGPESECQPGLICIDEGAGAGNLKCRRLCRLLDTPTTCTGGTTCQVLRMPDLKEYGACLSP